jgi:serine/threonine protein kinase
LISKFGSYEILYELKSGGMGSVLLGRRRGPGAYEQLVAIKTIRPEYANAPSVRAMFLDEAAILARLNHPGIAHVHDFGEEAGTLYMVMEYVAGLPFRDLPEPPPLIIAKAIAEAARGLHAAHEARDLHGTPLGLVHRDISPDNLLLGYDGHVKVIDFGIALIKNRQAPVTEFGTVKGKPPYMSPEQVKNEPMDRRSDVFSLAVTAWELLARRALFEGDSIYAISIAVAQQPLVPPSQALGDPLPLGLDAAIMNALDRSLATRTPTAAAFADSLEQVISSAGSETLAAWTDRVLAESRESHRAWLAGVVTGESSLPKAVGRATGQVTEVAADVGRAKTAVAPIVPTQTPTDEPSPQTSIPGMSSDDLVPARRSLAPLVLVLLLVLGGGIAAFVMLHGHPAAPPPTDAAVPDARLAIDAARPDAAVDAPPPPVDAMVSIDAPHHAAKHVDAAVAVPAAIDAAPAAATGSGIVTIKYKGTKYAVISIDGGPSIPGPLLHKNLAAGPHTIRWYEATGEPRSTQTITVHDGDNLTVSEQ